MDVSQLFRGLSSDLRLIDNFSEFYVIVVRDQLKKSLRVLWSRSDQSYIVESWVVWIHLCSLQNTRKSNETFQKLGIIIIKTEPNFNANRSVVSHCSQSFSYALALNVNHGEK